MSFALDTTAMTFYGEYTIVFFDMMVFLGEAVTDLAIFGYILYNVFGEGSNSVIVSR